MIELLLTALILLLYAAVAVFILFLFIFFWEKIFGTLPARAVQVMYAIVALIFIIWFIEIVISRTPPPLPWRVDEFKR